MCKNKSGKQFVWVILGSLILLPVHALAELRDPTRPSGFFQNLSDADMTVQSSDALRLQAIFYSPTNPGAMINGHRFTVGDVVADATITAIHADFIVLTNAEGETKMRLAVPSVKSRTGNSQSHSVEGMK